jgi:hypothetical protein
MSICCAIRWTGRSWFLFTSSSSSAASSAAASTERGRNMLLSCWWLLSCRAAAHVRATQHARRIHCALERDQESGGIDESIFRLGHIQTALMIKGCIVVRAATVKIFRSSSRRANDPFSSWLFLFCGIACLLASLQRREEMVYKMNRPFF